ncbi:NAD-dependent protein deacetylase hst2-1 [Cyphellophora attinorum]|uniref:NAD-dependent protein deacetylase n=1 Tax=Cyphellophora attinorum TaxID=1664694 RepID=A0A0N1NYC0_9EURO|nr:NAD-dependent protein deacetylase hst2-1 [Phialophora attinorum]KPI39854.1 NAD-dependent protein deacetylase hst2-1 [Phialophora attinorum]
MGNESSTPVDEATPPTTLIARNMDAVARYIKERDCKRIVVMTGAGISTSAGIPDFRSPETGLYANLARLNLPFAEAVFDVSYFRNNPLPFYTLAHELYPGKYRPTVAHSFISLLNKKGMLLKLFTQNIDCLEREAGVPGDKIVEAHGSFATQRCIECKTEYPGDKMKNMVAQKEVPHCVRKVCDGLVKPDIVFFGEALPEAFHRNRSLPAGADLAIVMGTSLTVQPFASLPSFVSEGTPRILINLERVGGLGSRPDDVLMLGDCDEGKAQSEVPEVPKSKQEALEDEIEKLTKDIDQSLKINQDTSQALEKLLSDSQSTSNEQDGVLTVPTKTIRDGKSGLAHVFPHLGTKDKKTDKPSL